MDQPTHVEITWFEGNRFEVSMPYPIDRMTRTTLAITDEDGREIVFSHRRSGRWVRRHQPDGILSHRVLAFRFGGGDE